MGVKYADFKEQEDAETKYVKALPWAHKRIILESGQYDNNKLCYRHSRLVIPSITLTRQIPEWTWKITGLSLRLDLQIEYGVTWKMRIGRICYPKEGLSEEEAWF